MSSMHVMDLWNIAWDNKKKMIYLYIKLLLFKIALQYYKYVF